MTTEDTPVERPDPHPTKPETRTLAVKIAGPDDLRSGPIVALISVIVLGIVVAVMAVLIARAKRKGAEERVRALNFKEELKQTKEDAKLADNLHDREMAKEAIGYLMLEVAASNKAVKAHEARHADLMDRLTKVNGWDDLTVKGPE